MFSIKIVNSANLLKINLILFFLIFVCFSIPTKVTAQSSPFITSAPNVHEELIESPQYEYIINLGGTADMDNTTIRGFDSYKVAFQPNISLVIENAGSTPVVDPWIVINDVRDWFNIDRMVAEATRGAAGEQERLMLLYEFTAVNWYHTWPFKPLFSRDELHDPVKHFNSYGTGFCDDIGWVTCALAYRAGFTKERHGGDPFERSMHGHMMSEIAVDGNYQFIDPSENVFYLEPENERAASGDEIVRDSDLAIREYPYGPLFKSWQNGERASSLLGRDDTKTFRYTMGHEMHLTLRPKEKLTLRWSNIGKIPGPNKIKYYFNSALDYEPELNRTCIDNAYKSRGIKAVNNHFTGSTSDAFIIYEVKSPYVMCGGKVYADFYCGSIDDKLGIAVSLDGKKWKNVWNREGNGSFNCHADIEKPLAIKKSAARYNYFIRISLSSKNKSARLSKLKLHTDLLTAPIALPRLSLGENRIIYTDNTAVSRKVKVIHTYQESWNINPPKQPELVHPDDGRIVKDDWIKFKWNKVPGADKYHLRVSRRPDLRTTYRPCYDIIIEETEFENPRTGLFNPDETYYWSVCALNKEGLWGEWSSIQKFSRSGPRPPIDLNTFSRDGKIYLTWKPNPRGNRPVRYEVYAGDIKGFKPSKTKYNIISIGEVPSNFVTETQETEILIVSDNSLDNAPNKSSYRIIAVDKNGTSGGSSWPLELTRPFIYSKPLLEAKVGKSYKYKVLTLKSLGDLQQRYQGQAFWEREDYEFSMTEAPEWLTINRRTGIISGKPGMSDIGKTQITINVKNTFPYELKNEDSRSDGFVKSIPEYQTNDKQTFILTVTD